MTARYEAHNGKPTHKEMDGLVVSDGDKYIAWWVENTLNMPQL